MKRDMNLVHKILIEIEKQEPNIYGFVFSDYDNRTFAYHMTIMEENGLFVDMQGGLCSRLTDESRSSDAWNYRFFDLCRLTWKGHDLLDLYHDKLAPVEKKWAEVIKRGEEVELRSAKLQAEGELP